MRKELGAFVSPEEVGRAVFMQAMVVLWCAIVKTRPQSGVWVGVSIGRFGLLPTTDRIGTVAKSRRPMETVEDRENSVDFE
jgi:hypothetical protein